MLEIFKTLHAGGTIFNSLTVILGSTLGLLAGKFIPDKMRNTIFNCLGLFTMYVGINMTLNTKHSIAVLLSLVVGSITGEIMGLEEKLNGLGDFIRSKIRTSNERFTEGFVTATLLFCVGSMAIIGAFEDGIKHNPEILMTKGVMDGIASTMLAGSFGIGVIFSVIPMAIYQGALTFAAVWAEKFITPDMYANISGLGGLMILGIGLNMLNLTKLKLGDMLPGLLYVIFFTMIFI